MAKTLKFMGLLALIVLAHLLWTWQMERRQGEGDAARYATSTVPTPTTVMPTAVTTDGTAATPTAAPPTAAAPLPVQTPAAWRSYRGDVAMSGACEGNLGDRLTFAWRFRTGAEAKSASEAAVKSSAVIDGGRVFIGSSDGNVYAIGLVSGEKLWSFDAGSPVVAPPMLLDQSVIVGTEGNGGIVYSLDVADGSVRWSTSGGGKVVAAANHFVDSTGRVCILVGSWGNMLHCFAADDGRTLWSIHMGNYVNAPCSLTERDAGILPTRLADVSPVPTDAGTRGRGDAETDQGNGEAFSLRYDQHGRDAHATHGQDARATIAVLAVCDASIRVVDLDQRKVELDMPTPGLVTTAVAVRAGRGYAGDSKGPDSLYCIDLATGDTVWQRFLGAATMAPASVTDDRVLVATAGAGEAALHCFTLEGDPVWQYPMSAGSNAGPLVVGDRVLLAGDDGYLRLLRLADGVQVWSYRLGGPIESSPAVAASYVVVGCNDGYVYAFKVE